MSRIVRAYITRPSRTNLRIYAVTRCLDLISEASRRPSHVLKARHPLTEWREMAAAENIYRHEYGG